MAMKQVTPAMQEVLEEISELTPVQQDELAAIIREELAAEQRWDELLADPRSPDVLARMAEEARAEHRRGETRPFGADDIP
jgi:hypothetical protein